MSAPICSQEIPSGFYPGKCVEHFDTWRRCVDLGKMVYTDESDVLPAGVIWLTDRRPPIENSSLDLMTAANHILSPFMFRGFKRFDKITTAFLPGRVSKPLSWCKYVSVFIPQAVISFGTLGLMDYAAETITDRTAVDVPADLFG